MAGKPSKATTLNLNKEKEISIPLLTGSLNIPAETILVKEGILDQWGTFPRVGVGKGKKALLIIYDVNEDK